MDNLSQWLIALVLVFSSLGVILLPKPVHASLSFLLTLLALAALYLQLSAQFIAAMQVLVYAGAILVIFMFVIVLFQDAHQQIARYKRQSSPIILIGGAGAFLMAMLLLAKQFVGIRAPDALKEGYGTVQTLGKVLYLDFFFPFEAVVFLFLIALIGALYIAKKVIR
jgi:NADH-quinone oxidoreductase subunit J